MPAPIMDLDGVLAISSGISLGYLAELDDAALEEMLGQVLPEPARIGDRLWSQGGCAGS